MQTITRTLTGLLIISSTLLFGQAGSLDLSFGNGGKVFTTFDTTVYQNSMAIQADGKIVVVGSFYAAGADADFALVRHQANGALDSTFGINGKITTTLTVNAYEEAYAVAIQADGKILVAGVCATGFALLRYLPNGTIDSTFGINGNVGPVGGANGHKAKAMLIQPDGKILVSGVVTHSASNADFVAARYSTTGTLDSTFGVNGIVMVDIENNSTDGVNAMALQADGKILLAGKTHKLLKHFAVVRCTATGQPDSTFGVNGIVITYVANPSTFASDEAYGITVQPDGKILAVGYAYNAGNTDFGMVRYDNIGNVDGTFGSGGIVNTDIGGNNDYPTSVTLQPDGKILVAGYATVTTYVKSDFVLARYDSLGILDNTFGSTGIVTTNVGNSYNIYNAVTRVQPDGKILVSGQGKDGNNKNGFALVRYISDLYLGTINFVKDDNSVLVYPNPIQQGTAIEYTLTKDERISISMYDINGKLISPIINEMRSAGTHKDLLNINPSLPAGNYIISIGNGSQSINIKTIKQ